MLYPVLSGSSTKHDSCQIWQSGTIGMTKPNMLDIIGPIFNQAQIGPQKYEKGFRGRTTFKTLFLDILEL